MAHLLVTLSLRQAPGSSRRGTQRFVCLDQGLDWDVVQYDFAPAHAGGYRVFELVQDVRC